MAVQGQAAIAGQIGQEFLRKPLASLAIRVGLGVAGAVAAHAQEGEEPRYGRPTGLIRGEHLIQERPDRQQRRVQPLAITDLMTLQRRLDLRLGQQSRETQVSSFHHLPSKPTDLATEPSLGILVHDRPPCESIAITTISSAWRSVLLYSYRSLMLGLWKCHSGLTLGLPFPPLFLGRRSE
jgi:hypothetical protein